MQDRPLITYENLKAFIFQTLNEKRVTHGEEAFTTLIIQLATSSQQEFHLDHHDMAKYFLKIMIDLCMENHPEKNKEMLSQALRNLFLVFKKQGGNVYDEADDLFQHYEQLLKKIFQEEINLPLLYTHYALGYIAENKKREDDAQRYYEKILKENNVHPHVALREEDLAHVYASLGSLLLKKEQAKQATQYFQKALLIFQRYYPNDHENIVHAKKNLNAALACNVAHQSGASTGLHYRLQQDMYHLQEGDKPLDLNAYLSIPPCNLYMSTLNDQIIFIMEGKTKNLNALRKILTGPNGLLNLMNQSSQSGRWSLTNLLPKHDTIDLYKNDIVLYYCDKQVYNIFNHHQDEEFHARIELVKNYFRQHTAAIWYTALVELSGYFHLPLLSRLENIITSTIEKLPPPRDERVDKMLAVLEYVANPEFHPLSTLEDRLHALSTLPMETLHQLALFPVKHLLEKEKLTEEQIIEIVTTANQHLDKIKSVLFDAYAGEENAPTLTSDVWLILESCLQLLNIFKVHFVRQQLFLQQTKEAALLERAHVERKRDYDQLQESKLALLERKQGTYIVADENYPERDKKGWPFSRTLPEIERLHGLNNRYTLEDKLLSEERNRFNFSKVLQPDMVVVDPGAGSGRLFKDLREQYPHLNLYLVAIGIDQLSEENISLIDEIWYMPLPLADHIQAFVDRFKNKVGLMICTFGATTYSLVPHKVVILAAYLLRRGGRFSAIISSQPGHYDASPLGYTDDRKKLRAFIKKYTGMEMTMEWNSILSAVERDAKPRDLELNMVRPFDAPDVPYSLQELFDLADIEIGIPNILKPNPNHPYQFNTKHIHALKYAQAGEAFQNHNHLLELEHIQKTQLKVLNVKDVGIVFQIRLTLSRVAALEKIYLKVKERLEKHSTDELLPSWMVEKNVKERVLTISHHESSSIHYVPLYTAPHSVFVYPADEKTVRAIWIHTIETLLVNGIAIPNVSEKIDSALYPLVPIPVPVPQKPMSTVVGAPTYSFDEREEIMVIADDPFPHPDTGEPVFPFRLMTACKAEMPLTEIGAFKFYGQPSPCRSASGDQHNVIDTRGFLSLDPKKFTDICKSLPPTTIEKYTQVVSQSAIHGIIRGTANVFHKILGTSNFTTTLMTESLYYVLSFSHRCLDHAYASTNKEINLPEVVSKAFADTTTLFASNVCVRGSQKILGYASNFAKAHQWNRTSNCLDKIGQCLGLTLFGYNIKSSGLLPAATAMASGALSQAVVERGADKVIARWKPKRD